MRNTEFYKKATVDDVRSRMIIMHKDFCNMLHKMINLVNRAKGHKEQLEALESEIEFLTKGMDKLKAEINQCETFLLGAKRAGATNASNPISDDDDEMEADNDDLFKIVADADEDNVNLEGEE